MAICFLATFLSSHRGPALSRCHYLSAVRYCAKPISCRTQPNLFCVHSCDEAWNTWVHPSFVCNQWPVSRGDACCSLCAPCANESKRTFKTGPSKRVSTGSMGSKQRQCGLRDEVKGLVMWYPTLNASLAPSPFSVLFVNDVLLPHGLTSAAVDSYVPKI